VDKARRRAMPPEQRQSCPPGRRILASPCDEGPQLLHAGIRPRHDPGVTIVPVAVTDQAAAGLDLVIRAGPDRIEAEEMRQEGLLGRAPVFRCRKHQACRSEGAQGGGTALGMVRRVEGRQRPGAAFAPGTRLPPPSTDVALHRPPRRPVPLGHARPPPAKPPGRRAEHPPRRGRPRPGTRVGNRSATIRRGPVACRQKQRRTCRGTRSWAPARGTSATVRREERGPARARG
jgi:hypothetical protein